MRFTQSQSQAVAARGNVAVSAAAGSGKTRVLTERVVRLLEEGALMESMLIVTFSNAAADEMKQRVIGALELSGTAASHSALKRVDEADICTLHSFCLKLIREHSAAAGLSPGVRVLGAQEACSLKRSCVDDAFDALYEAGGEGFMRLCASFGGRTDAALKDFILALHEFAVSGNLDLSAGGGVESLRETVRQSIAESGREKLFYAKKCFDYLADKAAGYPKCRESFEENARVLSGYIGLYDKSPVSFAKAYAEGGRTRFKPASYAGMGLDFATHLKAVRTAAADAVKGAAMMEGLNDFDSRFDNEAKNIASTVSAVLEAYGVFASSYAHEKNELNAVDFGDFENLAIKVLTDGEARQRLSARVKYVFVDECQDLSPVQHRIIDLIGQNAEMFMVGDKKQSIYRFRNADPSIFSQKLSRLEAGEGTLIRMNHNFRSGEGIVDFINQIMERTLSERFGEVAYGEGERLIAGSGQEGSAEIMLALSSGDSPIASEARAVAERIAALAKEGYDYGDMAILLREAARTGPVFAAELTARGVPASLDISADIADLPEVEAFLRYLKVLDFGTDLDFICVLRAVYGFSAADLAKLRVYGDGPLMDCARSYALNEGGGLAERLKDVFDDVESLRARLNAYGFADFLLYAREMVGYELSLLSRERGRDKARALTSLIESSLKLPARYLTSLSSYLLSIERMKKAGTLTSLITPGERPGAVKIMTIHRSKGLEFPVVFLSGLGRRFNRQARSKSIVLDGDFGVAPCYVDVEKHIKRSTLLRDAAVKNVLEKEFSEELRLLYVGMTRAKSRLVLSAGVKDLAAGVERWLMPGFPEGVRNISSYLDLVMPHALSIGVRGGICAHIPAFALKEGSVRVEAVSAPVAGRVAQPRAGRALELISGGTPLNIDFSYRYEPEVYTPSKRSVTGLKDGNDVSARYIARAGGRSDQAAHGTAVHALLKSVDFKNNGAPLSPGGLITQEDVDEIAAFLSSPLSSRIRASELVLKETPFCIKVSAPSIGYEGEDVLVQGVIDLCFLEKGGWVIVDYKTDRVAGHNAIERSREYAYQLELYASALSRITGRDVTEKIVYFLKYGPVLV